MSCASHPVRVASFPTPSSEDAESYVWLLERALKQAGSEIVRGPSLRLGYLLRPSPPVDIVHLHWLEYLTEWLPGGRWAGLFRAVRALRLLAVLTGLRARGVGIVWTIHNLLPHDSEYPRIDRGAMRAVLVLAHRAIVHSRYAAGRVQGTYGHSGKLAVIPNGNYVGQHPEDRRSREQVRQELGIPEDGFVYLVFGQVRRYKGIPLAIWAFRSVEDRGAQLLIAGSVKDSGLREEIDAEAASDPRVKLVLRFVRDDEVVGLFRAADAAVLPYREIFSSAAMMLAISHGLPVVAPAGGVADEQVEPEAVESYEPGRLAEALRRMRAGDLPARRRAAFSSAERYGWDRVARETIAVYDQVRSTRHAAGRRRSGTVTED